MRTTLTAVQAKPLSHKDKRATVQQTLGVGPEVAEELTSVLDSDECALPPKQGLAIWLTELANCWTETGFPIFRVVPVLQKQPGLRFVQTETIQTTLTWLCGKTRVQWASTAGNALPRLARTDG